MNGKMKFFVLLSLAFLFLFLVACGNQATDPAPTPAAPAETSSPAESPAPEDTAIQPLNLTIYSPGNRNSVPTQTIFEFARLVEEASDGAITFNIHHSGELGNDAEAIDSTRMGTIDIIFAGTSGFTSFYQNAMILDLPFLFETSYRAFELLNGEVGHEIFGDMENYDLVFLAQGDNGMRQIATTNRPIHTAADVAGLRLRVPTSQMYLDVWEALGATPIGLPLPELAIALATGTAEGQDNAPFHLVANATYDSIQYFSMINYMWMGCTMVINANLWNSLSEAQQNILREQAVIAARFSFDTIAQDDLTAIEYLQAAGVVFNFEPDVQSFRDMLGGNEYFQRYADEPWFNQSILDALLGA